MGSHKADNTDKQLSCPDLAWRLYGIKLRECVRESDYIFDVEEKRIELHTMQSFAVFFQCDVLPGVADFG